MKQKMFVIADTKAEIFNPPFFKNSHGEAERDFRTLVNDEKSQNINQYPEDFDLYYIGEYDMSSGKIESLPTPQHMLKAVTVKTAKPSMTVVQ